MSVRSNLLHIDQNLLERYALGDVRDEDDLAPVEEHVLVCCTCLDRLAQLDG